MNFEVKTGTFKIETAGFGDVLDLTGQVQIGLSESSLLDGNVTVFVPGSTAGITTIEYEPGAVDDLKKLSKGKLPLTFITLMMLDGVMVMDFLMYVPH